MKREYFGMLFIILFVAGIFLADSIFGDEKVTNYLSTYIVVWVAVGFYAGQHSMRFPKAF